jgi:hypothetical protein
VNSGEFLNRSLVRFSSLNNYKFAALVSFFVLLKTGVHPIGTEWIDWLYSASKTFPEPQNYFSGSPLPIFIARVLDFPSYTYWWFFHAVLYVLIMINLVKRLNSLYNSNFRKVFILIITTQLIVSPILYLGHYDLYTIGAASVAFSTRNKFLIFACSLVASLANPEQALATSFCLYFVYLGFKLEFYKLIFMIWFSCSAFTVAFVKLFVVDNGSMSRASIIQSQLPNVLLNSFGVFNLIFFSLFGVFWIWVILYFYKFNSVNLLIGAVLIPLILSIVILDHTRVGVAVGALPLLLVMDYAVKNKDFLRIHNKVFYLYFIFYYFVPQIFLDFDLTIRLPYQELIRFF